MGFSPDACLALEFAAQRYAAVVAFSGGLVGPPGTPLDYPLDYSGGFEGMPTFIGCSDIGPHVPLERVRESGVVFRRMGASVHERIYARMGHTINADELEAVDALLAATM
jgi:predicted esterase